MNAAPADVLVDAVQVRELTAVLRELECAGAMPLVFKGAALAHTHYPQPWLRPRIDADVLIAPDSRQRVFAVLKGLSYERPAAFVSGELVMYQAPFFRTDHLGIEHALDIHWRIVNPQVVSGALTHAELVSRSVSVTVEGSSMRVPCAVDALLLACIHRAAHHDDSEDPVWIYDIHLIANGLDRSEWRSLAERASSQSVKAICARGLRLACDRYQTRVPADVLVHLDDGQMELSALFLRKDLRPLDRLMADVRALSPRQAARLVREHLFPPADYMKAVYGFQSGALLPAYYAVRALAGLVSWFREA